MICAESHPLVTKCARMWQTVTLYRLQVDSFFTFGEAKWDTFDIAGEIWGLSFCRYFTWVYLGQVCSSSVMSSMCFRVKRCPFPHRTSGTFLIPVTVDADTAERPGRLPAAWKYVWNSNMNLKTRMCSLITNIRLPWWPIPVFVVTLQQFYSTHL